MACPGKYGLANYFGIMRREVVASTIDVNNLVKNDDCGCATITAKLTFCEPITQSCQKGITSTLVDIQTGGPAEIPAGSFIRSVVVVDKTCGHLDCALSFMLGFLTNCIDDESGLATLAQRIAGMSTQITGQLLNLTGGLTLIEGAQLNASSFASTLAIYTNSDLQNNRCAADFNLDTGIIFGQNSVGEPKALMLAATVTSGTVCPGDVEFFVCFAPPCPGVVCKPVIECVPCAPSRCGTGQGRGCSPCDRAETCGSSSRNCR